MPFLELTMPLNHEYMADEILPTATPFVLAPPGLIQPPNQCDGLCSER